MLSRGDLVLKIALFAFIAWNLLPLFDGPKAELTQMNAHRSESMAYQVIQIYLDRQALTPSYGKTQRHPASTSDEESTSKMEGSIGKDPWGDPYHYRIETMAGTDQVVVWSEHDPGRTVLKIKQ